MEGVAGDVLAQVAVGKKRPFNGHCQVEINILVMVVSSRNDWNVVPGERAQHSRVVQWGPVLALVQKKRQLLDLSKLCVIVEHQTVHHFAREVYRFRGPEKLVRNDKTSVFRLVAHSVRRPPRCRPLLTVNGLLEQSVDDICVKGHVVLDCVQRRIRWGASGLYRIPELGDKHVEAVCSLVGAHAETQQLETLDRQDSAVGQNHSVLAQVRHNGPHTRHILRVLVVVVGVALCCAFVGLAINVVRGFPNWRNAAGHEHVGHQGCKKRQVGEAAEAAVALADKRPRLRAEKRPSHLFHVPHDIVCPKVQEVLFCVLRRHGRKQVGLDGAAEPRSSLVVENKRVALVEEDFGGGVIRRNGTRKPGAAL